MRRKGVPHHQEIPTSISKRFFIQLKVMEWLKLTLLCLAGLLVASQAAEKNKGLQIGVKERPEKCDMRTKKGDKLSMHYTVRIEFTFKNYHFCIFGRIHFVILLLTTFRGVLKMELNLTAAFLGILHLNLL